MPLIRPGVVPIVGGDVQLIGKQAAPVTIEVNDDDEGATVANDSPVVESGELREPS